jgi:DNA-binding transcriptional regulator/RsmH inhibitor MraZ
VEVGGERWQVSLDRHGRLYVPSKMRPMFERAKTIMVRKEDDTLVLKLLPF